MPNKEKQRKILYCVFVVIMMILLLSGDLIISKLLPVNPNQEYLINSEDNSEKVIEEIDSTTTDYDVSYMKEISLKELVTKIKNKETIYVFSGRSTCSPCRRFVPVLKEISTENNLTNLYYINRIDVKETNEGYEEFIDILGDKKDDFNSTPFFMSFKNGLLEENILGMYVDEEELKKVLTKIILDNN